MDWNGEIKWLVTESKNKGLISQVVKTALAGTIYVTWRSGNDKIFTQKDHNPRIIDEIRHNVIVRSSIHRKLSSHIT